MTQPVVTRFAPSPTGRMHLGNIYTALVSWLQARKTGGRWILRIEDLDPQRSRTEYARQIEDDLRWLGLDWDEGGLDSRGNAGPYVQSERTALYGDALAVLAARRLLYTCSCRRADILATQAPHQSDGRIVYAGTCRPAPAPPFPEADLTVRRAVRIFAPSQVSVYDDIVFGRQTANLVEVCGDFVLRRADGAFAYQLAVVVDDHFMGVNQVIRGNDLLLSTHQQLYLHQVLDYGAPPSYLHLPLLCNAEGRRLSKRDPESDMAHLRDAHTPARLLALLAPALGIDLRDIANELTLSRLLELYTPEHIPGAPTILAPCAT